MADGGLSMKNILVFHGQAKGLTTAEITGRDEAV
jgi:hypothetical protein